MHPSRAGLIAFCDGAARRRRIANHLAACQRCEGDLRRIRREKDELSISEIAISEIAGSGIAGCEMTGATGDLEAGLAELLSSMAAVARGPDGPAVSLLERPGMRADAWLAKAGEILDALLGPAAGEAVRDEVLGGLDCARRAAETHRSAPVKTYPQAPAKTHPQAQAKTQK